MILAGKQFDADSPSVSLRQTSADRGGSTSIRNNSAEVLRFKASGYFQRNRDLGQVFVAKTSGPVTELVLRTGNSDAAVLSGTPGQEVFVQWFAVEGSPVIDDNGTPKGTDATHGYSKNHRCDDFITGVEYNSIGVIRGGTFPDLPATRDPQGQPTGDHTAKLNYLRFQFSGDDCVELQAGQRYAFLVGLATPAPYSGFTLANSNRAGRAAAVPQDVTQESRVGGWGIRREGNGGIRPRLHSPAEPEKGSQQRQNMISESMLPPGNARYELSPQTDGYPDVDTYRDLEFYLIQTAP